MNGAIFYTTRYGSTAQYAKWISEATGLPAFDVNGPRSNPSEYDFLILDSPIIYHKLMFHKWVKRNFASIRNRPVFLFSVSGAGSGPKLDAWLAGCLPAELISHVEHFALLGRQNPKELTWFDRLMLIIGGLINPDPVASKEELNGFDLMNKSSIKPIVDRIEQTRGDEDIDPDLRAAAQ